MATVTKTALAPKPIGIPPGSALSPAASGHKKPRRRWLAWLVVFPITLLLTTYVLGRTVEGFRGRLKETPWVGTALFADPVWPILWNKPSETPPATDAPVTTPSATTPPPADSELESTLAARLAAVEVRETAAQRQEQDLKTREEALRQRENELALQEVRLGEQISAAEALTARLDGQKRSEEERVAVVREMKSSSRTQLFTALDDSEAIRILSYLEPKEIATILAAMEPYRAARLLLSLQKLGVTVITP